MSDQKLDELLGRIERIEQHLNISNAESKRSKVQIRWMLWLIGFIVLVVFYNVVLIGLEFAKPENPRTTNMLISFITTAFFTVVVIYTAHERKKDAEKGD